MEYLFLISGLAAGMIITALWLTARLNSKFNFKMVQVHDQLTIKNTEIAKLREKTENLEQQLTATAANLKESNQQIMQLHGQNSSLLTTKASMQDQLKEIANLNAQVLNKNEIILQLNSKLATAEAEFNSLKEKLSVQKIQITEIQDSFYTKFQQLASEILENKSRKFTELNQTNIQEILKPLQEKIREFETKVEYTHLEDTKQRSTLGSEIRNLVELNNKISKEANNLANALKNNVKAMGNWGELILESILENSGLVKDREYRVQPSFNTVGQQKMQPDVVVYFPDNRCVIIDAKVSLMAYERFVSSEEAEIQELEIKAHQLSIKQHIDTLSAKNYPALLGIENFNLDFVLMFMPVEPAYMLAMQKDPALWNYAYQKKIILVSPTNLIAILKMISSLWKQEYQNQNVREIARLSGTMYDKFCGFLKDLEIIGSSLDSAQKNYQQAVNKLSDGNGNLIRTADKIKTMGAKTNKTIPDKWLDPLESEDNGTKALPV